MNMFAEFHFLRPEWFYALIPLAFLLWLLWRQRLSGLSWYGVVEPRLLPHLLIGKNAKQRPRILFAVFMGGILSIIAMAGPAWKKIEVPVFRQPSALVVMLDMSRSMDAADIKPSRLLRAQMKLRDILSQQKEGETALIVFAATPFVVSPLTTDAKTIASQLDSLSTDLMPAQGTRPDRAIVMALQLLQQSGIGHGGVLLISDGIDGKESKELKGAINNLVDAGHRLSVLGVGTPEGAPIATSSGGFVKDHNGTIVLPRLNDTDLEVLARLGKGSYRRLSADDSDFHAVLAPFKTMQSELQSKKVEDMNSDQWRDEGPWLLLPLLLGAFAFRRGYELLFLMLLLPLPRTSQALDWNSLWLRDDQRGEQAMRADDPKQAANLFKNPEWRAAANYRAGNYQAASEILKNVKGANADYNRGNALAKQGELQEAINAYEEALKRNPKNEDAKFNRDLVKEMLKQQPPDQSRQNRQQQGEGNDQQQGNGNDNQNKTEDINGQGQSSKTDSSQSQSGSERKPAQLDGKEGKQPNAQQQDAHQRAAGKDGKDGKQAEQGISANDTAAKQQEGDRNDRLPENNRQMADAQKGNDDEQDNPNAAAPGTADQDRKDVSELQQADNQWLRRIPDDPGGLWRRKFLYQYKQQQQSGKSEDKTW